MMATLGRLIALYEHQVFTQSVVWGGHIAKVVI